jgi:hypothetical protein
VERTLRYSGNMHAAASVFGVLFLAVVLLDAFQTVILPRRPVGKLRLTRLFFLATWSPWSLLARHWPWRRGREQLYSMYGPLSLLLLFILWACLLIAAYAFIYFGMHLPFNDPLHPVTVLERLRSCFYISGTTIFTLGLGDVTPITPAARILLVLEAGTGLGFVALVIGYVPVLYATFSDREIEVALLDARGGSPPTAAELLARHNFNGGHHALMELMANWERWCALLLETHISYPILCYYRSQHDNQSWLAALTAMLDTCALLITTVEGASARQAQLTFAIGRHVLVDLGHVFHREEQEQRLREAPCTRLGHDEFVRLCDVLSSAGFALCGDIEARRRLDTLRKLYEPHAQAMAKYLHFELPLWAALSRDPAKKPDPWSTVAGLRSPSALADRLSTHVSSQSAAGRLEDYDSHPL